MMMNNHHIYLKRPGMALVSSGSWGDGELGCTERRRKRTLCRRGCMEGRELQCMHPRWVWEWKGREEKRREEKRRDEKRREEKRREEKRRDEKRREEKRRDEKRQEEKRRDETRREEKRRDEKRRDETKRNETKRNKTRRDGEEMRLVCRAECSRPLGQAGNEPMHPGWMNGWMSGQVRG